MRRLAKKIRAMWAVLWAESHLVVTQRGDDVFAFAEGKSTDVVWDASGQCVSEIMDVRKMDREAECAVARLKKECGIP
jgi:hypothetical protein